MEKIEREGFKMNKRENSGDFLVKLIVVLGAIAAIFVAGMLIYRKCSSRLRCLCDEDAFDFDDSDFIDECDLCDAEDCSGCALAKGDAPEEDEAAEEEEEA